MFPRVRESVKTAKPAYNKKEVEEKLNEKTIRKNDDDNKEKRETSTGELITQKFAQRQSERKEIEANDKKRRRGVKDKMWRR
jgi:hypothetical protein